MLLGYRWAEALFDHLVGAGEQRGRDEDLARSEAFFTRDIAKDLQSFIMRPWLGNVSARRCSALVLAGLGCRFPVGLGSAEICEIPS